MSRAVFGVAPVSAHVFANSESARAGLTVSSVLVRVMLLFCLLQLPLMEAFPIFRYFDETLAVAMLGCYLFKSLDRHRINGYEGGMVLLLCIILFLGLIGNLSSGLNQPLAAIAQDAFATIKLFVVFLGAKALFESRDGCGREFRWLRDAVRVIVLAGVVCLVLAHLGLLDMLSSSKRLGIHPFEFIYDSAGMLSQYCVLFTAVLLADFSQPGAIRSKWVFLALDCILWASTLRSRALAMLALMAFMYLFLFRDAIRKRLGGNRILGKMTSPLFLVACVAILLAAGWSQLGTYFGEDSDTARAYLLQGGIDVMMDYFPLGTGFATYGTEAAKVYYSPLYYEYGLSSHWGLSVNGTELTDTFWPAVGAQFGAIGLVAYIACLIVMFAYVIKLTKSSHELLFCVLFIIVYSLVASTATGVFFSYTMTDCMFIVGLICGLASSAAFGSLAAERAENGIGSVV